MNPTFATQARAGRWANERLYAEMEKLAPGQLAQDFGVNFGSVLGIANHTILADRAWLARFLGLPPVTQADYAPATAFADLRDLRANEDQRIIDFAENLDPARLSGILRYANLKGEPREEPYAICLAHFFNHQTFHRGQMHALLGVLGLEPPDLDLIFYQAAQRGSRA